MNFGRVVRMTIRYKFTFVASIISALMVALLSAQHRARLSDCRGGAEEQVDAAVDRREDRRRSGRHCRQVGQTGAIARRASGRRESGQQGRRLEDSEGHHDSGGSRSAAQRSSSLCENRQALHRQVLAARLVPHAPVDYGLVGGGNDCQGFVPGDEQSIGGPVVARTFWSIAKLFYRRTLRMDLAASARTAPPI